MKTLRMGLLAAGLFLFVSNETSAQLYENMPAEVQQKMDENKAGGIHLLNGVKVDYELTIEGVTNSETAIAFEIFLKRNCELISFSYDNANQHVSFTVPAIYDLDVLKKKFSDTSYQLGLYFKETYHL